MISMARTFGAPLTVPAGSVARRTSIGTPPVDQVAGHLGREVHHVAVALERQQLVHVHGAEAGDAADVVAGQVDQHDVLGHLLGVLPQLAGHAPVVLVGAPPTAGAGDGPGDHPPAQQLHHRLGRGPDDGDLRMAEEVHVRAGVDLPQHPVHVVRVGVELQVVALGQHHLEDVAGPDVLLRHLAPPAGTGRRAWSSGPAAAARRDPAARRPSSSAAGPDRPTGPPPGGRRRRTRHPARRRRGPGPARCRSGRPAGASGRRRPASR